MKVDQNEPRPWILIGLGIFILGAIAAAASDSGLGRVLMIAGAALAAVGLLIFVVRAGTRSGQR